MTGQAIIGTLLSYDANGRPFRNVWIERESGHVRLATFFGPDCDTFAAEFVERFNRHEEEKT
jgi:hypothetical protein